MRLQNTAKYDDIIHMPHHVSSNRQQMPVEDRAAQFSPFAALTGHDAAIKETARLTDKRVELDENEKSILNEKLLMLAERIEENPEISVTYFVPDRRKDGGMYTQERGSVKKIDEYNRQLIMKNGMRILIDEIIEIENL